MTSMWGLGIIAGLFARCHGIVVLTLAVVASGCGGSPRPVAPPADGGIDAAPAAQVACAATADGCTCQLSTASSGDLACSPDYYPNTGCCATSGWPMRAGTTCSCRGAFVGTCHVHRDEPACRCTAQPLPMQYWPTQVDACTASSVSVPPNYGAPICCKFATACQCFATSGSKSCSDPLYSIGDGSVGVAVTSCSAAGFDNCPNGQRSLDACNEGT